MGDVVDFPTEQVEDYVATEEDQLSMLTYRWWLNDFYPMFEESGKLTHSYYVYGELFESIRILHAEGMIEVIEEDDQIGLGMEKTTSNLIYETIIGAFNQCQTDSELKDEETIH